MMSRLQFHTLFSKPGYAGSGDGSATDCQVGTTNNVYLTVEVSASFVVPNDTEENIYSRFLEAEKTLETLGFSMKPVSYESDY